MFIGRGGIHPLESVDRLNPRPGLRSWVLNSSTEGESSKWREAWVSVHDDGSVTLAAALGGHRTVDGSSTGDVIAVAALETAITDLMGLVGKTSNQVTAGDYDLRISVEWSGEGPMTLEAQTGTGWGGYTSAVLAAFTPIKATVQTDTDSDNYYDTVYDVVCDAVNQAGVQEPRMMSRRERSGR